jgi:hypothetical protein
MEFEKEQIMRRLSNDGEFECFTVTPEHNVSQTFRNWVKHLLWDNVVLIEFEKVDGTTRIIECTSSEKFGARYASTEKETFKKDEMVVEQKEMPKKKNDNACAVWDIKKSAWRSFRWDRIRKIDYKVD